VQVRHARLNRMLGDDDAKRSDEEECR
jgi:hypothetical protein